MNTEPLKKQDTLILALFLLVVMSGWFWVQAQQGINANIAWLSIVAERMMEGGKSAQDYYEVNPPASILLYAPVTLLVKHAGLSIDLASFLYAFIWTGLALAATARLLYGYNTIDRDTRLVLFLSFAIASLLMPGVYFGDREHLVTLGLAPLCLALLYPQDAKRPSRLFLFTTIGLGAALVLVKPPFLVIPGAIVLYRLFVKKEFTLFLKYEFLTMLAVGLAYLAVVWIFFHDYVTIILPDVVTLYLSSMHIQWVPYAAGLLGVIVLIAMLCTQCLKTRERLVPLLILASSIAGLVSFALQGKGFYYHLIPSLTLFSCGTSVLLFQGLREQVKVLSDRLTAILVALTFTAALGTASNQNWLSPYFYPRLYQFQAKFEPYIWPTHKDYKNSDLTKLVNEYAPDGSYFILGSMPMILIPSAYTESSFGSRFAVYWFLPPLIAAEETHSMPPEKLASYKTKYAAMVGEDFKKFRPDVVILGDIVFTPTQTKPLDFAEYFSIDPEFRKIWSEYRKVKTVQINSRDYYGGYHFGPYNDVITYNVYVPRSSKAKTSP